MHEIDHPKVFSSRDAIPEELRAEFEFSHVGVPDVYMDSNGKLFHGAPGGPHCGELTLHPLCCFIKSKLCSGDSSIVIKERLQEGSYSKYEYIIYDM